ncbi:MAG: nitrate reductase molybdenum cofactor assembly chaperone [Gallionellales bacterium RBG_16_56_9]|nr:MAG: nitrate reductase molybdenum cofactor assembly chaperone [Gallionellales bacterium RBG_16_56_9]
MRIYKILSALLEYPEQELMDNLPEIRTILDASTEIDAAEKVALRKFLDHLASMSLTELQAEYVRTFDSTPEHSLHLTHHLFSEDGDRERGPALIDLGEMFKEYGVKTVTNELPDYLPLLLEFASCLEDSEATVFLSDVNKVLNTLTDNLTKANSHYAAPLSIIESRATLTRLAA